MPGEVIKGFEGFLHQAGGSCAVSHPQVLKALYRPDGNCQAPYPKLEVGRRQQGELRTWAASSPRPGPGSARAKWRVFPGLGVLGWPVPRVPAGCGRTGLQGVARVLSALRLPLLYLDLSWGGQTTVLILFDPHSPPSSFSAEKVIPLCTLGFGERDTYPPLSKPAGEASCPVALVMSVQRSWRERSHGTASSRSPPRSAGSAPCVTALGSSKPPSRRFRGSDHTVSNEKVDDPCWQALARGSPGQAASLAVVPGAASLPPCPSLALVLRVCCLHAVLKQITAFNLPHPCVN